MTRRQRRWLTGLVVAALAMVVAACGGGAGDGSSSAGGGQRSADPDATLRFAWTVPALPLDPHTAASSVAQAPYLFPVYDRLTELVAGPELRPMVATEWAFGPDGRQVTFTLREGVTFHDGSPVEAAAVKASLDRARSLPESTVKDQLSMVESVDVVDPRTVRITTNRPASDLPYVLSGPVGAIINPAAIDRPDLDQNPAGSGPYGVAELRLGDRVVYERSPGYWNPDAQKAARIELIGITDDNARLSALRSGQVDAILSKVGQHDQASRLGDGFEVHSFPAASTYAIMLNTGRPHLDDATVRQALNYAIDREAINTALLDGQCTPQTQPLTPTLPEGYLENPPVGYTHDPERARQLLAEAGLPNGFDMTMLVGAGLSPQDDMAPVLQAQLAEVGVRLHLDVQDAVQTTATWAQGNADAYLQTRVASPTAELTLRENYLVRSRMPGPTPPGFADALQRAFDPNLPAQERKQTLNQASEIAVTEALDVFLCAVPTQTAYSDRVIGIESMGQADLQGIFDLRYVGVAAEAS
jgi:peptide/nickel transport system substrate-binding protein